MARTESGYRWNGDAEGSLLGRKETKFESPRKLSHKIERWSAHTAIVEVLTVWRATHGALMPATKKAARKSRAIPAGNPEAELASFLAKFTPEIAALTEAILAKMRARYPMALELVYDNYNALAIGFAPIERTSSAIFSIAVYPQWVSLFFLQAKALPDPHKLLQGNGSVVGYIRLPSPATLDDPAVRTLMLEAESSALVLFDPKQQHRLIIKSVSANQRPRRPTATVKSAVKKQPAAKKKPA